MKRVYNIPQQKRKEFTVVNHTILSGRLTADPIIHRADTGTAVVIYTLAVRHNYLASASNQPDADFIRCVAFGRVGEFVVRYLHKGTKVAVQGRIQTSTYDQDGTKRYSTQVVVTHHEFLEPKRSDSAYVSDANRVPDTTAVPLSEDWAELPEDETDDLPF